MARLVFLDNDVILKLVVCNLFWEAVASLELSPTDLWVLETAKHVFRKNSWAKKKYPEGILDRAISIVEGCTQIKREDSFDEELQALEIDGIDPGEGLLIAATKKAEEFYLATGDKQCLIALASAGVPRERYSHYPGNTAPSLSEIRKRLSGRVVCFEQLLKKSIEDREFDDVLAKVLPGREYDGSLKAIFGSGWQATQENVLQALNGYIEDLRSQTDDLLADL